MMYQGMTIVLIILGIGAIVLSFYKDQKPVSSTYKNKSVNEQEQYEEYSARIEEVNKKILELNEYSEFMKSELDKKHKELLFLYQLIHEKTKEIKSLGDIVITESSSIEQNPETDVTLAIPTQAAEIQKFNNNKMILQLSQRGYSVKDIAQTLEIGQGEVKLVLDLFE
ncbi:MAG: hypothetical protein H7X94_04025 [Vallitaleaceae bacterium]|nr:hypothetical protein [Vallitaleaceae bacterium]